MIPPNSLAPPTTVGGAPLSGWEVNQKIGNCLQQFLAAKEVISHNQSWLAGADLKVDPYNFSATQETDIKSAVASLDAALAAIDMTFVNRLIGLV